MKMVTNKSTIHTTWRGRHLLIKCTHHIWQLKSRDLNTIHRTQLSTTPSQILALIRKILMSWTNTEWLNTYLTACTHRILTSQGKASWNLDTPSSMHQIPSRLPVVIPDTRTPISICIMVSTTRICQKRPKSSC